MERQLLSILLILGPILKNCLGARNAKTWSDCSEDLSNDIIDCSNLGFKHIPLEVFSTKFKNIKLGGNPYICDCAITKFVRGPRFPNYSERILDPLDIKCSKPSSLEGKLAFRKDNDFCLEKKEKKIEPGKPPSWKSCKILNEFSLDCSNMGFEKPPLGVLDTNYAFISLGNNPYVCDCNITSFLQRFDRNDFHGLIEDMFSITCAKPDNLNGTSFLKIIKDDISLCPEKSVSCEDKPCSPNNEECIQQGPFFKCVCKKGFHKEDAAKRCKDIDECYKKEPCGVNEKCKNTYGSYRCDCKTGYSRDGKYCSDVDECTSGNHDCHKHAVCLNRNGSYKCRCKIGFTEHNQGRLCVEHQKEKKESLSVTTLLPAIVATASLILSIGVVGFLWRRKRLQSKKKLDIEKEQMSLLQEQEKLHGQMFFFDGCFNDMPAIPPNESTITEWSEEESYDEDESYEI